MKKISKVISIILAVMMVISTLPITASAATYSGKCGDNLTWTYDTSTYTLTISGTGAMDDYYYDNNNNYYYYNRPWESYEDNIENVVINNGVTSIGDCAFYHCDSLTSVTIGDSVTTIGDSAFYYCTSLTSVTIPDSVTTIGYEAFYRCYSLTSVTIGDSVTTIGEDAFRNCTSLASVTIGDSVTTIGDAAFYSCSSLTSVTIPDSVITIGDWAFGFCHSLTSVTIPDSVTTIGERAFYDCSSLTSITVDSNNKYYSNDKYGVLFNKNKTTLIQYPIGNTRTSYTIPDSVTTIGDYAFRECISLTSVTIPDSVTTIGTFAFYNCHSLTSVTIPDSVTTIGSGAFWHCYSLTSVTIPDSVTTIGNYAFSDCSSLTSVTIPDSVTTIGSGAFEYCHSLTDVYYGGTEEQWKKISIGSGNRELDYATIHYNSTGGNFVFEYSDYTQTHVVEDYSSEYDAYEIAYFGGMASAMDGTDGNADLCVPGLSKTDDMIPQGIAYYPAKNWILISAYNKDGDKPSVIYALDKSTGNYVAQFDVYKKYSEKYTGKLGGIAVSDHNLYFTNGKSISYISLSKFDVEKGTVKNVTIDGTQSLSSQFGKASVSYVSFNKGVLYAGNFYNKTEDFNTPASSTHNSIIVGYIPSGANSAKEWEHFVSNVTSPAYKYKITNDIMEIQGATIKDGYLYLSTSYGRKNDSTLYVAKVGDNPYTSVEVNNFDYSVTAPPMMEGITVVGNDLYAVFESGAYFYRDKSSLNKAKNPTDVLWKIGCDVIEREIQDNQINQTGDYENVTVKYYNEKGKLNGNITLNFKQDWFKYDSIQYKHNIATLASQFITLGYDIPNLENDLKAIGFKNIFWETEAEKSQVDNFIASRDITVNGVTYTLLFVGCIGTNSVQWYSNFEPGTGETHASFNDAKNYVYKNLENYIAQNGIDKSKTKILLCGHSRGAATANLLAAQLIDEEKFATKENIYTYTFATPNPTRKENTSEYKYKRIFNFVNPEDFVTKVLPAQWGYSRYGTTYTLPSKSNTYMYDVMKSNMQKEYEIILEGKKYHPYLDGEFETYSVVKILTNEVENVDELYNKKFNWLGRQVSIQEFFTQTLCKFMASEEGSKERTEATKDLLLTVAILGGSDHAIMTLAEYFVVHQGLGGATSGIILDDYFTEAHQAETYCAYMMSMTASQATTAREGYKSTVNCPVDIEVYDKATGELVGRITNNVVDEEIAAKENSVVMSVDGDSKSFWLPSDGEYEVKLIGNDNGTMDYTVSKVNGDSVEITRVNFVDVEIVDNKSMSGDFSGEDFEIENYSIATEDNKTIESDDLITQDNFDEYKFNVTISTEGDGLVIGDGTYTKGDYVTVYASANESNHFVGWYENDILLSTNEIYSFVVQENRNITAKFGDVYNYTFSIQDPSMTTIRHKDGIKLHTKLEGTVPDGCYVKWFASNDKFKTEEINGGDSLKIVSDKNGDTTFTAILYDKDGNELARDTIEMKSKAGFFDKIGSFFRGIFGRTKIHES